MAIPTQTTWNNHLTQVKAGIDSVVIDLITGAINESKFVDNMSAHLEIAHTKSSMLGRNRAGDLTPLHDVDKNLGRIVTNIEKDFLTAFSQDIKYGRYTNEDGSYNESAIRTRAQYYSGRCLGVANETFVATQDDDTLLWWVMGGAENHCPDCPDIAANSPYVKSTIPSMPHTNETQCMFQCKCHIRTEYGKTGFKP